MINSKSPNTCLGNPKKEIWKNYNIGLNNRNINGILLYLAELICSGYIEKLINDSLNYYIENINIACPQALFFIYPFYKYWNRIDVSIKKKHTIQLVNDQTIRNWLYFFTTLTTTCNTNKLFKMPKIEQVDFDMKRQRQGLVSKNLNLVQQFLKRDDPKDIIIALSEICQYISNSSLQMREQKIIYWYSWIANYEKYIHKGTMVVGYRDIPGIDMKLKHDFVWIIWDIVKHYTNEYNKKLVYILFYLYCGNFTKGSKRSKSNLLFFAIYLITNPFPKIEYPLKPIDEAKYIMASTNSLHCNQYFLKLFQQIMFIKK
jgi:hypothetical protein